MRVAFTARHFDAPATLKEYAQKEVNRLKKYYHGILDCEIVLDQEKANQIAEINLKVYGNTLSVREKSDDIYKSIDAAVRKLERQLKKYKAKFQP